MKKSNIIRLIIIIIILVAMYGTYQYMNFKDNMTEQVSSLSNGGKPSITTKINEQIVSKVDNLNYNTGNPNDVWLANKEVPSQSTLQKEYETAKSVSSSVVGWIWIQGTNINYPVEYNSNDNNYYLTHNYRNQPWWNGAIFRDSSIKSWGHTVLINGHNMLNAVMFAQLMNFRIPEFYKANKIIELYNGTQAEEFKIVGAFYTMPDQTFDYNIENPKQRLEYYKKMQAKSIYGVEPVTDNKTLFINTCLSDGENRHIILMAQEV